jgi:phospholipid-binding lipoprotein MlaA
MLRTLLITAAAICLTAGAAMAQTAQPVAPAANPDPWEGANRAFFKVNKGLDRAVIRPTATFYHHAITHPVRDGVHNALYNLGEPVTFINNLLQIRPDKAGKTAVRFVVNSTVGVLGIFDVTGGAGLQREPSGFADTLGRYGASQGPYIFIPVFGPSSVRDLTGRVVDVVTDPFSFATYDGRAGLQAFRTVGGGLDKRVRLDPVLKDVEDTATDPYATERSAFLQSSSKTGDSEADAKALPDFGPEPGASPASTGKPAKTKPHP